MVLPLLTSVIYEVVQASWRTATIAVPLFLAAQAALIYREGELENFSEELIRNSRAFVSLLVFAGAVSVVTGLEVARFNLIGDLIALVYFGFLFWKF